MLKVESFHSGMKILLNLPLVIFRSLFDKNEQTKLATDLLHTMNLTVKSSVNSYIHSSLIALIILVVVPTMYMLEYLH